VAEPLVSFRGRVRCSSTPPPLGLTLSGESAAPPGAELTLAFSTATPAEFPETLADVRVESLGDGQYRIASGGRTWLIAAAAAHLHTEVAAQFYRAIPPRPVPLLKRLAFRVVLILAASRAGLALLRRLRR
jgi:hypothetical protein